MDGKFSLWWRNIGWDNRLLAMLVGGLTFILIYMLGSPSAVEGNGLGVFFLIWLGVTAATGYRLYDATQQMAPADFQEPQPPPPPPPPPPSVWYSIRPGKPQKWDPHKAIALIQAIIKQAKNSTVEFSIEATTTDTRFLIFIHFGYLTLANMVSIVEMYYRGAEVTHYEGFPGGYPFHRRIVIFQRHLQYPFFETLLTAADIKQYDPLAALTQAMDVLEPDERMTFTLSWIGNVNLDEKEINKLLTQSKLEAGQSTPRYYAAKNLSDQIAGDIARTIADAMTRVPRFKSEEERRYRGKLSQTLLTTVISVSFDSPQPKRLELLAAAISPLKDFTRDALPIIFEGHEDTVHVTNAQAESRYHPIEMVQKWSISVDEAKRQAAATHVFYLTPPEIAAFWHLPHEEFAASNIQWANLGQVPMPEALRQVEGGIQLGVNRYGTKEYPVFLPQSERVIPTTIIGKPGTGKSSLMHHMIHQDIKDGRGVCVIDPKGSLVSSLLQHSIPPGREGDLVVVDVKTKVDGTFYPPPLNLLQASVEISEDVAAGRLVAIFDTLFGDFSDRKMADTFYMALMVLADHPETTLIDVHHFLTDTDYRANLVQRCADPIVKHYWETFEGYTIGQQNNLIEPILWRLRSFTSNKYLRSMICQSETLNLAQMIRSQKIILVSLEASDNLIPERGRYLLGAYLVSQIDVVARERVIGDVPFMLYIDEAQSFVSTPLPAMLSQLREYKLGIVLANQYFRQMFGDTFDAIEGTASTLIGFEVGKRDADLLAAYMRPEFTADDFMALGNYRAAVSLVHQTRRQRPFTLDTLPPPGGAGVHFNILARGDKLSSRYSE